MGINDNNVKEFYSVILKLKTEEDCRNLFDDLCTYKELEQMVQRIEAAKHIVATVKEIPGIKIAADGTCKEQYDLMMAKKLLAFVDVDPEQFDVPLHFIQIGDVKFYGFPSEIFCFFGLSLKEKCQYPKRIVASYCNGAYGYVPTKEMFHDTVYESLPGSNRLEKNAGYIMVDKLIEMGNM